MNQPLKASSPQHNAIGGPLPVLLDFRNGGRGWRMSLGALVQATLLGLVLVPGAHGFFLENADQVNRTILRFLKSVRSK